MTFIAAGQLNNFKESYNKIFPNKNIPYQNLHNESAVKPA